MAFTVEIPVPPSLNNAYFNKRLRSGKTIRVMAPGARSWKTAVAWIIKGRVQACQRIEGAYDVLLELPVKMRGDSDNRLKLGIDALVMSGRVSDDVHARETAARKCLPGTMARITVRAAA
jgi:Holliday junction resolvase RusA-like endonuclease